MPIYQFWESICAQKLQGMGGTFFLKMLWNAKVSSNLEISTADKLRFVAHSSENTRILENVKLNFRVGTDGEIRLILES